jgi:chromosome segregation ATPase
MVALGKAGFVLAIGKIVDQDLVTLDEHQSSLLSQGTSHIKVIDTLKEDFSPAAEINSLKAQLSSKNEELSRLQSEIRSQAEKLLDLKSELARA